MAEAELQREQQAAAEISAEDAAAGAFAGCLPRCRRAAAQARARAEQTATGSAQARAPLTLAPGALEAVETMPAHRAEEARLQALHRERIVLDEIGLRRRK